MSTDAYIHSSRTKSRVCPVCATTHDAATGVSLDGHDRTPVPSSGDLSMCFSCYTMLVFTDEGYRLADQTDFDTLDPVMQQIVASLMHSKRSL